MDNFDFFYDQQPLDFTTPKIPNGSGSDSSSASSQAAGDESERETTRSETIQHLPLLRSSDIEPGRVYNREDAICIHYDLKWKILLRGIGKKRSMVVDEVNKRDLVLAPSDLWEEELAEHLASLLSNPDKFSTDSAYSCKGTVAIKAKNTRRGLDEDFDGETIPWNQIDQHLESLGILFKLRRMPITVTVELTYQETATAGTTGSGPKQRKSTTTRQREKLPPEAVFMTRVYAHHECNSKSCRQNSLHCLKDNTGNHHAINNETMRAIYNEIKKNIKEGETYEDVQNIEIPAEIRSKILRLSKKRKAGPGETGCRNCKSIGSCSGTQAELLTISGDQREKMRDYCTWNLANVQSDRRRGGMEAANKFAMEELLDLDTVLQHSNAVKDAMVGRRVPLGSALRFVSDIPRFIESLEGGDEE